MKGWYVKLTVLFAVTAMLVAFIPITDAEVNEINRGSGYTEYYGDLGRAPFYVLIPDQWTNPLGDRMLVVFCRSVIYTEDLRDRVPDYQFAVALAQMGIAVAASNYGPEESLAKDGIIRTHQLTEYVITNYQATGKVFLFGTSLGGAVALMLGEAYPSVYSGILDVGGVKDWEAMYDQAVAYSGSDPFLTYWYDAVASSLMNAYGTPDENPNKYAKYSPIDHADIDIPVISIIHTNDVIVSPEQTSAFHTALSNPSLHRVVTVSAVTPGAIPFPGATGWYGHFDPATYTAAISNLFNLIIWSNNLDT